MIRAQANAAQLQVQWLTVYIAEAHAQDEWPIGSKDYELSQHKTLAERANAAKRAAKEFAIPSPSVLVSLIRNTQICNTIVYVELLFISC